VIPYEHIVEETCQAVDRILSLEPAIEGIILLSNMIGLPAMEYLYQVKKIRIPQELKLISMEAAPYFSLMNPSITAVNLNIKQMAEKSMELLLRYIRSKELLPPVKYTVPVSLTIRESSCLYRVL
jgi:DNA-binding LacI/PurR family transcriptional regulator